MFNQLLVPVDGNLILSFAAAALPIATVLVALGILRRPAWQASLAGLIVGLVIAIFVWSFPPGLALDAVAAGAVFALWPVMWIVFNALLLYNIAVISGRFDAFRDWLLKALPNDRRVVLVVIGFCFGCKMISPQNIATGVSVTHLQGQEGLVLARTFKHSIALTLLLGVLVVLQQYVVQWMIP